MPLEELQLNDPVHIEQANAPLEGVVAHLGPVQFASGSDWIGIRLTGASVGKGKNDGTVKGERYFKPGGAKNGMFVKRANVKKRKLSKLEELRLRRELTGSAAAAGGSGGGGGGASSGSSASGGSGSRASSALGGSATGGKSSKSPTGRGVGGSKATSPMPRKSMSGKVSPMKKTTAASSAASAAGGGGTSKLEALRARREALTKERGSRGNPTIIADKAKAEEEETEEEGDEEESQQENETDDGATAIETAKSVNMTSATPGYRAELNRLQSKISTLESSLQKKSAECASLQSSLDFMSKGAEQSTHDAVRMYAMGALALTEAKSPMAKNSGAKSSAIGGTPAKVGSLDEDDDDSDSDSEGEDSEEEEGVVNQAAAAVSQALVERNNELTAQLSSLTSDNANLQHQLSEAEERLSNVTQRYEQSTENYQREKEARTTELTGFTTDKAVLTSQITSLERELEVLQERVSSKSSTQEHSHVSMAKLRAELISAQRRSETLDDEKMDLETTLEELVLDKEQLREEKEMLEDQLEECKIDLESVQLELEDAKGQLEDGAEARAVAGESGGDVSFSSNANADTSFSSNADAADVTRSLTLQNTRLRTALLRLREQSDHERNELQRQLKAYQSDSTDREEIQSELTALRSTHAATLREVQELKDIIDQTTSLEETIETLSDKVWTLEETNADLERTIRELEESAEIAAEMEEVQADELKMTLRDLEGRDALVGNLEEAIRMQRRREEDFQRYVSEFRTSISTLKSEKAALLALTDDNQGEKSHLLATSQKALAQAAQLAADAADARKRSSEAAFQKIAARSATYLSGRLETLLPSGVVSAELAAIKGEMSLAKVADKAAVSLTAVEEVFNKAIEKGFSGLSEFDTLEEDGASMVISDAANQQIAVMAHQAEFSRMAIEGATDSLRLMAAGQWPELLSQEMSADIGSVVVHSVADLELALSEQLRLLKSEGVLSPLRSSLTDLDQSVRNTRLALFSATDENGKTVIPDNWKPPGWEALKSLSLGRFACLGATAVLSSAVSPMEDAENEPPPATPRNYAAVLTSAKQSCGSMLDVCKKLSGLSLNDTETLVSLNDLSSQYQISSLALFDSIKTAFEGKQSITGEDVDKFASPLEKVLSAARLLAALLRKAELGDHDTANHHYLSAEFGDSWGGVTEIVSQVRSVDGDSEDVNYLMRARAIENQLAEAVQNEPKLVIANAKIASLEKSLSSRSKEIHMQNGRIAELETLISKSAVTPMSPLKGSMAPPSATSSVDTQKLKEEVRVLQEALDVMQKQGEEYEKEIRSLKDKSRPSRGVRTGGGRVTPKKSAMNFEATLNQLGQAAGGAKSAASSSRDVLLESISLETALFRPALSSAVQSANYWKTKAMGSALSKLAPLNVPVARQSMPSSTGSEAMEILNDLIGHGGLYATKNQANHNMEEVVLAKNEVRLAKASFSIVDLSNNEVSSRTQLDEERQKEHTAELRMQKAASSLLRSTDLNYLPSSVVESTRDGGSPLGRITLPCREGVGFVAPLSVSNAELRNLHSVLVQ
mmetsp:Transcript_9832/g.20796  ORF Transcript_9832/g.20796 Transcript_9832/m.20796 type:complete len:1542 (-) Transcript_9832:119-4744(-)